MRNLEKRLDRLEQDSGIQHPCLKLLMHNEGEPPPVVPDDGQQYRVVTFVKPKHRELDHEES